MSDAFDAYYNWLSIPPDEQPPNHYRLLGVKEFESNADVIAGAADRQMVHVRSFQSGKHAAESQRLLNELSAARICLLSSAAKDAYDRTLKATRVAKSAPRAKSAKSAPLAKAVPIQPRTENAAVASLGFDPNAQRGAARFRKRPPTGNRSQWIVVGVGTLLLATVGAGWLLFAPGREELASPGRAQPGRSSDSVPLVASRSGDEQRPAEAANVSPTIVDSAGALVTAVRESGAEDDELDTAEAEPDAHTGGESASRPGLPDKAAPNGARNNPATPEKVSAPDPSSSAETETATQGEWVDLLALVDPSKQGLDGPWARTAAGLRGEKMFTSIGVPLSISGDYGLHVEFTRLEGNDSINVILPVASKQCLLTLSAWQGLASGLQNIDGKDERDNATGIRPGSLENDHRYQLDFVIHAERERASIVVKLDGKPFTQWSGPIDSLGLNGSWAIPGHDNIGFGVSQPTVIHIAKLQWLNRPVAPAKPVIGQKPTVSKNPGKSTSPLKKEIFLSELKPVKLHLWEDSTLTLAPVVVGGVTSPHGLFTHPDQSAHVTYELPAGYRTFLGQAAINDSADGPMGAHSPVIFRIMADDKELWKSRPAQGRNDPQEFRVSVVGVQKLELVVECPGDWGKAHAVWIEPQLLKRSK